MIVMILFVIIVFVIAIVIIGYFYIFNAFNFYFPSFYNSILSFYISNIFKLKKNDLVKHC